MGCGVALYVKEDIESNNLENIWTINFLTEAIWVGKLGPKGYLKVVVY